LRQIAFVLQRQLHGCNLFELAGGQIGDGAMLGLLPFAVTLPQQVARITLLASFYDTGINIHCGDNNIIYFRKCQALF